MTVRNQLILNTTFRDQYKFFAPSSNRYKFSAPSSYHHISAVPFQDRQHHCSAALHHTATTPPPHRCSAAAPHRAPISSRWHGGTGLSGPAVAILYVRMSAGPYLHTYSERKWRSWSTAASRWAIQVQVRDTVAAGGCDM